MGHEFLKEGGPHKVKKIGKDQYSLSISIPEDSDGMIGRECPSETCTPAYFKIRMGTGIAEEQTQAFCPYCRTAEDPHSFYTKAQAKYVEKITEREALKAVDGLLAKALGLDSSGRRKIGGGLISMELKYKGASLPNVSRPVEEELKRLLTCSTCGLEHAVFGLAFWCPDCGSDTFLAHVEEEFKVITSILQSAKERGEKLGPRVAARDIENSLEDLVSIFETVLKVITKRLLIKSGKTAEEADETLAKKIRNKFQNVDLGQEVFKAEIGSELFSCLDTTEVSTLKSVLEKRHPVTHNLGIVDRKYLAKAVSGELEGREVRVNSDEVESAIEIIRKVIKDVYTRV